MSMCMDKVVFRFRSPFGQPQEPVSREMVDALMRISEAEEMNPMFESAEKSGRFVAIELYRAKNGRPLLINFTTEEA